MHDRFSIPTLILSGVLLGTSCSSSNSDSNKKDDSSSDGDAAAPGNEAVDAGTKAAFTASAMAAGIGLGQTLCLTDGDACKPPMTEATAKPPAGVLELNITNSPDRKDGEPSIAINPKNPDNLVAIYADFAPGTGSLFGKGAYGCHLQYSMDRGETWTPVKPWPPEGTGPLPECGESVVRVDADGTFYAGMNNLKGSDNFAEAQAATEMYRHIVSKSTDGGRTWSVPSVTYKISGVIKARVDQVTGKLYHAVSDDFLFPGALTVSADKAETWSKPVKLPGAQYAVHDGIFAASTQSENVQVFFSTDDGKTYKEVTVTDSEGKPVPAGANGAQDPTPWVTADPTMTGRFAVLVPKTKAFRLQGFAPVFDSFEVYVTDDVGMTWRGPTRIDAPWAALPWIDFGWNGALGILWRGITATEDGKAMVDAYATVSFDSGKTFSKPVRVNKERHPFGDAGPPADDWSGISIDDEYAYVSWVDVRSGETGDVVMSRVPLSVFRDASN